MVELVARDWRVWTVAKLLNGWGTGLVQGTLGVYVAEIRQVPNASAYSAMWP